MQTSTFRDQEAGDVKERFSKNGTEAQIFPPLSHCKRYICWNSLGIARGRSTFRHVNVPGEFSKQFVLQTRSHVCGAVTFARLLWARQGWHRFMPPPLSCWWRHWNLWEHSTLWQPHKMPPWPLYHVEVLEPEGGHRGHAVGRFTDITD